MRKQHFTLEQYFKLLELCNILITWDTVWELQVPAAHDGDELPWTMRCWAHLMPFECYSSDLSLWIGARSRNLRFKAYLTLPSRRDSCSLSSEISWTNRSLPCDQLRLYTTNSLVAFVALWSILKHMFPN